MYSRLRHGAVRYRVLSMRLADLRPGVISKALLAREGTGTVRRGRSLAGCAVAGVGMLAVSIVDVITAGAWLKCRRAHPRAKLIPERKGRVE